MKRSRVIAVSGAAAFLVGVIGPAFAYWTGAGAGDGRVSVTRLEPPSVAVAVTGSRVTLTVSAPTTGPAPSGYTVTYLDGETTHPACPPLTGAGTCVDDVGAFAAERTYTVTSLLGQDWRASITRAVATAPPTPTLDLLSETDTAPVGDGRTADATPTFIVAAPAAASDYILTVLVDGSPIAPASVVPAAGWRDQQLGVATPLGAGAHEVKAVASFLQGQAMSAVLPLTVPDDAAGVVAAPLPASAPEPSMVASPEPQPVASSEPSPSPEPSPPVSPAESPAPSQAAVPAPAPASSSDLVTLRLDSPLEASAVCSGWTTPQTTAHLLTAVASVQLTPRMPSGWQAVVTLVPAYGACTGTVPIDLRLGVSGVEGRGLAAGEASSLTASSLTLAGDGSSVGLVVATS